MRIQPNLFPVSLSQKLILISLLAIFISSVSVFAQDLNSSNDAKAGEEYFVLIATSGNSLNVRQSPAAFSPIVGKLLNGSEVPLIDINGDGGLDGNWFRLEFQKGEIGWVSKNYSRRIKKSNKMATARAANLESSDTASGDDVTPIEKTDEEDLSASLQSGDSVAEPVVKSDADPPPVEKKGFFASLFSPKTKTQNNKTSEEVNVKSTKPWANIEGFRSAKFGMKIGEVKKAIYQNFEIPDGQISTINHPTERTESLAVTVENLLPNAGKSRVVYVFGYKTKRLIQVNILTGHPVDTDTAPQQIVNSGNLLGNHFFKKRYQKDDLVAHARLSDGSILIFRGKDQKGRMALLRLSNPQPNDKNNEGLKMTLNLSYIEKPGKPDTYQLKDGDF